LKRRLGEYEVPPKGMLELWGMWRRREEIDARIFKDLIESMPRV